MSARPRRSGPQAEPPARRGVRVRPGVWRHVGAGGRVRYRAVVRVGERVAERAFSSLKAAVAWRDAQLVAKREGRWIDPAAGRISVAEWAGRWLAQPRRPSSRARDETILRRHILPTLGGRALASVSPVDCQALVATWAEAYAPRTVHRHHDVLAAMFNAAVAAELIARSPVRGVRLPRVDPVERTILTPGAFGALVDAHPPEWRAMPLLAGLAGLRWGEVAGLQVGDLDLATPRLHVRRQVTRGEGGRPVVLSPKTAAGVRSIALPAALAEELAAHLARRGLDGSAPRAWIFAGRDGSPLWYSNWRTRVWLPACRAAGLEGLRFHDLRALAATVLARTGVDVRTAMARLGHANVATTMEVYARALDEADREAADSVARYLLG